MAYRRNDWGREPTLQKVDYVEVDTFNNAIKALVNNDNVLLTKVDTALEKTDDLYARHDTMRADLNELLGYKNTVQYLWREIERLKDAPSLGRKRRKVTICANGQRVDIKRV